MWTRLPARSLIAALGLSILGCTTKPQATEPVSEDKTFTITPSVEQVKAGFLSGEMTDMKITEQVQKGSGTVETPPQLTATMTLKNDSKDQSASAIAGKFSYIGPDGKPIALEEGRSNLSLSSNSYGSDSGRLDPGQKTTRSVSLDFPAAALAPNKLKQIRLELTYIPSAYKDQTVDLPATIAAAK